MTNNILDFFTEAETVTFTGDGLQPVQSKGYFDIETYEDEFGETRRKYRKTLFTVPAIHFGDPKDSAFTHIVYQGKSYRINTAEYDFRDTAIVIVETSNNGI